MWLLYRYRVTDREAREYLCVDGQWLPFDFAEGKLKLFTDHDTMQAAAYAQAKEMGRGWHIPALKV